MPVGSRPSGASPYGVLDMIGSEGEWAADPYDDDYYEKSPRNNPKGPAPPQNPDSGAERVRRDPSGYTYPFSGLGQLELYYYGVSRRYGYDPHWQDSTAGFRCAMD